MQVQSFWMISSGASPILSSLWVWDYNLKMKLRNLTFPGPWDNAAPIVHTFHRRINACGSSQGILWLCCPVIVNSVHSLVAIRRDSLSFLSSPPQVVVSYAKPKLLGAGV